MRIKLLKFAGIDDRGQRLLAGQTFDVTDALALDLLAKGWAEMPTIAARIETAVARTVENAALRTTKAHRAK